MDVVQSRTREEQFHDVIGQIVGLGNFPQLAAGQITAIPMK